MDLCPSLFNEERANERLGMALCYSQIRLHHRGARAIDSGEIRVRVDVCFEGTTNLGKNVVIGLTLHLTEIDLAKWDTMWPRYCRRMSKGIQDSVRSQGINIRIEPV